MVGEIDLRVRPERIVLQEAVGAEQLVRIGDAEAMAQDRELAVRALFPLPALERVPELARQRETVVDSVGNQPRVVAIASTSLRRQPAMRSTSSIESQGTFSPEPFTRVIRSSDTAATSS